MTKEMGPLIMEFTPTGTESLDNQYRGREETAISNLNGLLQQLCNKLSMFNP